MSSPLTQVLQLIAADVAVEALPAVAQLATAINANSKQPIALQGPSDILALMQAEQSLIAAAPTEIQLISGQINALVQAKVAAWQTAMQAQAAAAQAALNGTAAPAPSPAPAAAHERLTAI